jgi:hypothetical protein
MKVEEFGLEILGNDLVVKVVFYLKLTTGYWYEITRDSLGNQLTHKDSRGYWYEYTRDKFGHILTSKNSNGRWCEYTRDEFGNELSYKCSNVNADK